MSFTIRKRLIKTNSRPGGVYNAWNDPIVNDQLKKISEQHNFGDLLGEGLFARVYSCATDPKVVYKVGPLQNAGSEAYLTFLKLIRKYSDNPFFPKVYDVTLFNAQVPIDERLLVYPLLYVVRLEKLEHLSVDSETFEMFESHIANAMECGYSKKYVRLAVEWVVQDVSILGIKLTKKQIKHYEELFTVLGKLYNDYNHDLHVENVMVRSNGQIVITDPAA